MFDYFDFCSYCSYGGGSRRVPGAQHSPSDSARTVMPAKQKILSILDRARNAMEESYGGYEEISYEPAPAAAHYESYSYAHGHAPQQPPRPARYEVADYEPNKYVREYYHREATAHPGRFFQKKISFVFYLFFLEKFE